MDYKNFNTCTGFGWKHIKVARRYTSFSKGSIFKARANLWHSIYIFSFWQFYNNILRGIIGQLKAMTIFSVWRFDSGINFWKYVQNSFFLSNVVDTTRNAWYVQTLPSRILLICIAFSVLLIWSSNSSALNFWIRSQMSSITVFNILSNLPL